MNSLKEYLNKLFVECEHGDEEHRQWLKNKIDDFYRTNSLWVNTLEEEPEHGIEVLGWHPDWQEEDETSDGIRLCFLGDEDYWTMCVWSNYQDCYNECHTKEYYSEEEITKIVHDYGPDGNLVSTHHPIQKAPEKWMYKIPIDV